MIGLEADNGLVVLRDVVFALGSFPSSTVFSDRECVQCGLERLEGLA